MGKTKVAFFQMEIEVGMPLQEVPPFGTQPQAWDQASPEKDGHAKQMWHTLFSDQREKEKSESHCVYGVG